MNKKLKAVEVIKGKSKFMQVVSFGSLIQSLPKTLLNHSIST